MDIPATDADVLYGAHQVSGQPDDNTAGGSIWRNDHGRDRDHRRGGGKWAARCAQRLSPH